MTTYTVTKDTGGTTKPELMVYVRAEQQRTNETLLEVAPDTGLNGAVLADLLSDCLSHERGGVHLYRSVAGRTLSGYLRGQYERFGRQTERHVEILEQLVTGSGGDPQYVSPQARATDKAGHGIIETTFLLGGSVDAVVQEAVMVDAVLLAEARCHANWELLGHVAQVMADGPTRAALQAALAEVEPEEDEHKSFAQQARGAMTLVLLRSDALTVEERLAALEQQLEAAVAEVAALEEGGGASSPAADLTKDELYKKAQELDVPGRSSMTKEELAEAVGEDV